MKRDLYSELENWKDSEQRKPLYLTGIRQCGKTWLAREFANNCFENCLYIDLMKKENQLLFQESDSPKALIDRLSFLFSQTIQPEKTLLIFDHLFAAPFASSLLSEFYFQAKRYAVMILDHQYGAELDERRSLNETNTTKMILKPLSFLEFLKAVGKDNLVFYLQNLDTLDPLFMPFYQDLLDLLNLYFHTGGFPQAIACWLETEDLKKVQKIQNEILRQITLDFFEKDPTLGFKARNIWNQLPEILQKPNNKFTYRNIDLQARKREYVPALNLLLQAELALPLFRRSDKDFQKPDFSAFKLYLPDIGLAARMAEIDQSKRKNRYARFHHGQGFLSENYVFLSLLNSLDTPLFYWRENKPKAEMEFLICHKNQIYPCLISFRHQKLTEFNRFKKLHPDQAHLCLYFGLDNLELKDDILKIPLFLAELTPKLIEMAEEKQKEQQVS